MLGHRELSIDDYIMILRRRLWVIVIPLVLFPVAAYLISRALPNLYTSTTLVLVEQQKVPDSFVKPVITEQVNQRLGTMQEQILSRTRLQPIVERFGIFKKDAGKVPMEDLVNRMRQSINVTPVQSVIRSEKEELPGFYVSFTAETPRLAQQVCAELTSMFIEENLRVREQLAQGTTDFLQSQLTEAKSQLDEHDAKLAEFKRRYVGSLPGQDQNTLNLLMTLATQLDVITQTLNRAQQDKVYAESFLDQQLAAWHASQESATPQPETLQRQLFSLQNQLVAAEARYTSDHPDVIKLKTDIELLKKKLDEAGNAAKEKTATTAQTGTAGEPLQIQQVRNQIHLYKQVIREKTLAQERLQQQSKAYQARLSISPLVEQQYKQLTRDYETALMFYNELLGKRNQSQMATTLERRQQGEQFRVMDPANLPEEPSSPNRRLFAAAGLAAGLALGLGIALLLELRDKAIRTEFDVDFYLGLPALALVPMIDGGGGRANSFWRRGRKEKDRPEQTVEA